MQSSGIPLEIERKYLIRMPDVAALCALPGCVVSEIEQTYLPDPAPGATERIRLRRFSDRTEYTHTVKIRLSKVEAREDEETVDEGTYRSLLSRRDPALNTVIKTRYAFPLEGQVYEVDVYPFWKKTAILETELPDASLSAPIPPCLTVIREVTGEAAYTNRNLARRIPPEPDAAL